MRFAKAATFIPFVAFVAGTVHFLFFFSLVTLSTFEAKPRGVYFEENSLLPSLSTPSFRHPDSRMSSSNKSGSSSKVNEDLSFEAMTCHALAEQGLPCWQRQHLAWTVIRPRGVDDAKEALIFVAAPPRSEVGSYMQLSHSCSPLGTIMPLLAHLDLQGRLAKTLVVLFPKFPHSTGASLRSSSLEVSLKNKNPNCLLMLFPIIC